MKNIHFSLREFCEVYALKTMIEFCRNSGFNIHWNLLTFPVNTDFSFFSVRDAFRGYGDVSVTEIDEPNLPKIKLFGFATDMRHPLDRHVNSFFSCAEIASCRLYQRYYGKRVKRERAQIVVGNIKVKAPVEEFQLDIFERLSLLPYEVILVPRHPLTPKELLLVKIPRNLEFVNTMGDLERLHASADLTIMGRVFSFDGLRPDDDHNPLEATINSNTICGILKETPEPYRWLYEESELLHQCQTIDDVFCNIEPLIHDANLEAKLRRKAGWIEENRKRYLEKLKIALELEEP